MFPSTTYWEFELILMDFFVFIEKNLAACSKYVSYNFSPSFWQKAKCSAEKVFVFSCTPWMQLFFDVFLRMKTLPREAMALNVSTSNISDWSWRYLPSVSKSPLLPIFTSWNWWSMFAISSYSRWKLSVADFLKWTQNDNASRKLRFVDKELDI